MVLVGQPKLETILEEGDIHTNGNRKHKIRSTKLSSKLAPHNHYWTVWPKLSLLMYNVYANIGLSSFGHRFLFFHHYFFCSHGLHVPENLCSVVIAKVGTRVHHDTFRRPMQPKLWEDEFEWDVIWALHFYKRHINFYKRSNRHLVACEGDFALYDAIAAPLCDAPRAPPPLCKWGHPHSLAKDGAHVWKVAKRSHINKFVMWCKASL